METITLNPDLPHERIITIFMLVKQYSILQALSYYLGYAARHKNKLNWQEAKRSEKALTTYLKEN